MSTSTTSVSSTSHSTSATVTSTTTTTPAQQRRLQRATDTDDMDKIDFNRNRRSRRQISTRSTTSVTTKTTSPKSTSFNSVKFIQPPPPTVINLTVESVEDLMLMMADLQEQKAVFENETSVPKDKSAKGNRKNVATGNPRGRPPRDPSKNGDRDKGQGLA
jgi:short subunit dehydrogenase-like uncharacterized protein